VIHGHLRVDGNGHLWLSSTAPVVEQGQVPLGWTEHSGAQPQQAGSLALCGSAESCAAATSTPESRCAS